MTSTPQGSAFPQYPKEFFHEFLLAAAATSPDRPAVVEAAGADELRTVTYRQLERQVFAYAVELGELGLEMGDRVVVESDTSASAIALVIACSSLGLTFVPVSPQAPAKRLEAIIEAAEPALHLQAVGGGREDVPEHVGAGVFGPDLLELHRKPTPRPRSRREAVSTDPAYIIFTSGTTGRPKGVVMSHRGVTSFYRGMLYHGIVDSDARVATTSPLQFDFSLLDIGLALGSGATVVPVPRDRLYWPRRFLRFLRDAGVTQVDGAPSIWRPVLRHEPELLAELDIKGVLYSGEEFPLPELRQLQSLLPGARIVNCYGSTESMAASFTDVPRPLPEDAGMTSIGFAHPGAEMILIDEDGRPVREPGGVGEIYLRSSALFLGYWGDPEATSRALVPDPLNPRSGQLAFRTGDLARRGAHGELYFGGRIDSQVKIQGNRVELGEVERKLLDHPGVAAAAVLLLDGPGDEPVLSAFITMDSESRAFDKVQLRAHCAEELPEYMIPQEIHVLEQLPVTTNGKVDRKGLAARFAATEGSTA
ncbi:D-alanine--poly(phosphoribitol) ligase [Saccharothrix sp. HUAS TT1]|uniref:D-alanine--poly(phosphoribitol) ligase n=1 Tax=unclassified Saccharothrix TaxID=2593673 RepID=UPI00345C4284